MTLGWILLTAIAVIVVILIVQNQKAAKQPTKPKQKGAGPYLAAMSQGDGANWKKRKMLEEAAQLGFTRALTALGVMDWRDDNRKLAKQRWKEAAGQGDEPACILRIIHRTEDSNLRVSEFCYRFMQVERSYPATDDLESALYMCGAAAAYGFHDYAREMSRLASDIESRRPRL